MEATTDVNFDPEELFASLHGNEGSNYPSIDSPCHLTSSGTRYLQSPGVIVIASTHTDISSVEGFLSGYDESLQYRDYLLDDVSLPGAEQVVKFAGQVCYQSFGPRRTTNARALKYFQNILIQGHGSVLEHASVSMLFYGIDRSVTHELVRHRAGTAISQTSQRYVDASGLRFVERPEYQVDPQLHQMFVQRIDRQREEYEETTQQLMTLRSRRVPLLNADRRTDLRKKVQQAARSVLSNEAEAPLVFTANIRAWRHIISMRASEHAEVQIRELLFRAYLCLMRIAPELFADYRVVRLNDETYAVSTPYAKV